MTVSTVVDHNDYTGNGVTTSFPYTFRIFKKSDLAVSVVDLNENITVLVLDTDYTVTNAGGYNGGNVVLTAPLTNGWQISIARELEPTQETDLRNQGKFFAEVHEDAFDKLTMLIQQAYSVFRLALRKPSSIANWYDALNNYIRNLKDPRDPQDAATKNYVDTLANSNLSRTLRVPEPINQLPGVAGRRNMMPAFDNDGNAIVVVPPSGSASDVLIQLASTADGKGDALIGVKQPFAGSVGRTQHDVNADMVINVKDCGGIGNGSASAVTDIAAVQAAINAYAPMTTPVHVRIPRGTWNLSGITIPRRGVVLDLTEATIEASSGVVFSRSFPQLAAADFKAAYPPLDGNQTYFRPIVIKGGTVNLSGTATFLEIRQPFLAEYSTWGKTLVMDDTQIKTYGNSIAFAIHGGWGFDFNSVAVTGDVTASTGFGASVGSGTCLYMRPDGTYNTSSHAQLISFNNCIISYCTVVDSNRGNNGGSAEALYFFNSNCMFVNGGTIDSVNLFEIVGGMFVTTIKEFIINRCAGVIISNIQAQRYNNPRNDARYGMFQFLGGGSEIKIDAIRCVAGANLTGCMFGFYANTGEEFLEVSASNIQYVSGGVADLNEADVTKQTSVVRFLQFGTGRITGASVRGLSGRQTHNLVDFSIATPGNVNRMELKSIRNVGSSVKRRVLGLSANISNIDAPEMYAVNFIRMRSAAVGATATICAYENFRTQLNGSTLPVATISNNTPVSNAVSISFSSWDNVGNVILALNQAAGLTAGMPVECTATLTLNSSEAILA